MFVYTGLPFSLFRENLFLKLKQHPATLFSMLQLLFRLCLLASSQRHRSELVVASPQSLPARADHRQQRAPLEGLQVDPPDHLC